MKKITLVIFIIFVCVNTYSQGLIIFDKEGNDITSETMVLRDDADVSLIKAEIFFHNATENTIQVMVRKIEVDTLAGTFNTFCWNGSCFPPFIYESHEPMVLEPGQTSGADDFYGEYIPNGQSGFSIIEYEFFCETDCFDTVKTTVVYATNGVPFPLFNIADGAVNIPIDQQLEITSDISLKHEDGSAITEESLPDQFILKTGDASGSDVAFDATINEDHTQITISPREDLDHGTTYYFEVLPMMGFEGEVSEAQSISFTTHSGTNEPVISFNVIDGDEDVAVDHVFVITSNQRMWHADGTEITHENLTLLINFKENDASGADVAFEAQINEEHTEITIAPINNLAYNAYYFLELMPVMGEDEDVSEAQSITFKTETETSVFNTYADGFAFSNPFPNPAADHTTIAYELPHGIQNAHISVYSVSGRQVFSKTLDPTKKAINISTGNMQNGMYFYSINVDGNRMASGKIIVSR